MVDRSDSDGLHVGAAFYEQGGIDTRPAVNLHDCELQLVVDGSSEQMREMMSELAGELLSRDNVSEAYWTVTKR